MKNVAGLGKGGMSGAGGANQRLGARGGVGGEPPVGNRSAACRQCMAESRIPGKKNLPLSC